jgi:hypothetical protein
MITLSFDKLSKLFYWDFTKIYSIFYCLVLSSELFSFYNIVFQLFNSYLGKNSVYKDDSNTGGVVTTHRKHSSQGKDNFPAFLK